LPEKCYSFSVHYYTEGLEIGRKVETEERVKKKLFLKWAAINTVATFLAGVALFLGIPQAHGVSVVTQAMAALIGIVYILTTLYAGYIAWNVDKSYGNKVSLARIRHDAKHIKVSASTCPLIGIVGSVIGMLILLSANASNVSDAEGLKKVVSVGMGGIGVALIPTVLSVSAAYVLLWVHHVIEHDIDAMKI
jgi:putative effector of murein hydrolase LrgA (UPF0299 family)